MKDFFLVRSKPSAPLTRVRTRNVPLSFHIHPTGRAHAFQPRAGVRQHRGGARVRAGAGARPGHGAGAEKAEQKGLDDKDQGAWRAARLF